VLYFSSAEHNEALWTSPTPPQGVLPFQAARAAKL
jgi:hypothetical protein